MYACGHVCGIQNLMCVGALPWRRYVRDAKDEGLYLTDAFDFILILY